VNTSNLLVTTVGVEQGLSPTVGKWTLIARKGTRMAACSTFGWSTGRKTDGTGKQRMKEPLRKTKKTREEGKRKKGCSSNVGKGKIEVSRERDPKGGKEREDLSTAAYQRQKPVGTNASAIKGGTGVFTNQKPRDLE